MVEKGYNIIESAEMLGVQPVTVRRWAETGKIKANKIAGTKRWVILESEIKRLRGESNDSRADY